ncbi:MAG: hypothetical protein ACTSPG_07145 [Candidatus Hodarchaeales archaeon]
MLERSFLQNMLLKIKSNLLAETKWFYISLIANITIHLFLGLIYKNPVDFVLQFEAAKDIARGKLLYRDIDQFIINNIELPRPQYPPLYLYTLALFILIIGVNNVTWQMVKMFLTPFSIFVGIFVYKTLKKLLRGSPEGDTLALVGMNFFYLNPATLGVILGGYHEYFMLFFVIIGFYLFNRDKFTTSGLFLGLGLLVKPTVIIYLIPIALWGIKNEDWNVLLTIFCSVTVFILGSLPFLILAPNQYLNDVFFIHTTRLDPNMSIYYNFFDQLLQTPIPFLIQLGALFLSSLILLKKMTFDQKNYILQVSLPILSLFLLLNRILYPHYIPFLFPFLCIQLFSIKLCKERIFLILGLTTGLILIYVGEIWWTLLWMQDTWKISPYSPISSLIMLFGLILISITSLYVNIKNKTTMPS